MDADLQSMFTRRQVAKAAKRASNRAFGTQALQQAGLTYTEHNHGSHLIVSGAWDYWPGTGLWRERHGKPGIPPREGRGVHRLLKLIEEDASVQGS